MRSRIQVLKEAIRIGWLDAGSFVRTRFLAVLLLTVAGAILVALGPVLLKLLVDEFSGDQPHSSSLPAYLVALLVASQLLARATQDIRGYLYSQGEQRILRGLTERVFAHLLHLPLRFHLERRTGAINRILDDGLDGYHTVQHNLLFAVLPVAVEIGAMIVVLTQFSHTAFLALFCGALVLYAIVFGFAVSMVSPAAVRVAAAAADTSAALTDGIMNYETVKYFTAEALVQTAVNRRLKRKESAWVAFQRAYTLNALVMSMLFAAFLAVTIWLATREVQQGTMTLGEFVLVCGYMLQSVRPVEMLGFALHGISQGLVNMERLLALLHETPEVRTDGGVELTDPSGVLEFQNVSLSYGPQRPVLRNVSFKVRAGHTVGIVGTSGSGKSTIVRLLVGLIEPQAGRILLDNVPISHLSLPRLRSLIAVVPQATDLFDDTIGYNIGIGAPTKSREEIERAARLARLHDFIMRLPEQYQTRVGERGVMLSAGEKQRLSIARATIKEPRIYVFDEATSSLDSETENEIMRSIREVSSRCTTFVIAHRLSTVVHADEIVVLDRGQIVETGTHERLLRGAGRYATLWNAQHGR